MSTTTESFLRRGAIMRNQKAPVDSIKQIVADYYGVPHSVFTERSRTVRSCWPRQVAMALAFEFSPEPEPALCRAFNKYRNSALIARETVNAFCLLDKCIASDIRRLRAQVRAVIKTFGGTPPNNFHAQGTAHGHSTCPSAPILGKRGRAVVLKQLYNGRTPTRSLVADN